jgi:hypothetical protein
MSKDAALYAISFLRAELRSDRIYKLDHGLGMTLKVRVSLGTNLANTVPAVISTLRWSYS